MTDTAELALLKDTLHAIIEQRITPFQTWMDYASFIRDIARNALQSASVAGDSARNSIERPAPAHSPSELRSLARTITEQLEHPFLHRYERTGTYVEGDVGERSPLYKHDRSICSACAAEKALEELFEAAWNCETTLSEPTA